MVYPADVRRIVTDAARLVRRGELAVFGSSALAFWLEDPPTTRDVDLFCRPPERGEPVEALMGELSWYHERHGAYVEVWGPETFAAPAGWRARARVSRLEEEREVTLVVPHPHDVLFARLERMDEQDMVHMRRILDEFPLSGAELETLARESPHERGLIEDADRVARFRHGLERLRREVGAR